MKAKNTRDEVIRLTAAQKIQFDVIDALSSPKITACFTADITDLDPCLARWSREQAIRISLNTAIIKAAALTLRKFPTLGCMPRGYQMVRPVSIDIGVSVAGVEILSPVVVVKAADTKSLADIAREVQTRSEVARREEGENMEKISRWARWFPFDGLRRRLIRWALRSQRLRYHAAGNFQISNVSNIGIDWATSPVSTSSLLMIGARRRASQLVDDRSEVRTTVRMTLTADHRVLNGRTCGEFVPEICRILRQPEELLKEGKQS